MNMFYRGPRIILTETQRFVCRAMLLKRLHASGPLGKHPHRLPGPSQRWAGKDLTTGWEEEQKLRFVANYRGVKVPTVVWGR